MKLHRSEMTRALSLGSSVVSSLHGISYKYIGEQVITKNKKLTKKRKTSLSFVIELIVFHLLHFIPPIDQSRAMLSLSGSCLFFKDRLLGKCAEKRCDFSKAILFHTVVCEICCLVLSGS